MFGSAILQREIGDFPDCLPGLFARVLSECTDRRAIVAEVDGAGDVDGAVAGAGDLKYSALILVLQIPD